MACDKILLIQNKFNLIGLSKLNYKMCSFYCAFRVDHIFAQYWLNML